MKQFFKHLSKLIGGAFLAMALVNLAGAPVIFVKNVGGDPISGIVLRGTYPVAPFEIAIPVLGPGEERSVVANLPGAQDSELEVRWTNKDGAHEKSHLSYLKNSRGICITLTINGDEVSVSPPSTCFSITRWVSDIK